MNCVGVCFVFPRLSCSMTNQPCFVTRLCGFEPFDAETEEMMFRRILKADYKFLSPYWDHISQNAKHLVSSLLLLKPEQRLTAADCLKHPWVMVGLAGAFDFFLVLVVAVGG
jgi:serine/threonine protein kinase